MTIVPVDRNIPVKTIVGTRLFPTMYKTTRIDVWQQAGYQTALAWNVVRKSGKKNPWRIPFCMTTHQKLALHCTLAAHDRKINGPAGPGKKPREPVKKPRENKTWRDVDIREVDIQVNHRLD